MNRPKWKQKIWLFVMFAFMVLCLIVWVDEILDFPHIFFGAGRTPINWKEALLETFFISIIGFFTVLQLKRNVLQRRKIEEKLKGSVHALKESNIALEHFAYIAAHDLKAPLRSVELSAAKIIEKYHGNLKQDDEEYLYFIREGVKQMDQLINGLLDLSRIGIGEKIFSDVNCEQVLERTIIFLRPNIEENKANITHDPLPTIYADESLLLQLFQNLIANAIKFRREGPLRIHISASQELDKWIFSFKDNGIGIKPEYYECIFELFRHLHSRQQYEGVGIGLAICKKIVAWHGGRIWVESEVGKGTKFYFSLPSRKKV